MRVCQLVLSPTATHCHPLHGVIIEYLEKAGLWTPFSLIFNGFQDLSPKRRSGYISGTISTSLCKFAFGLSLVFSKKIYMNLLTPIKPSLKYVHKLVGLINNTETLLPQPHSIKDYVILLVIKCLEVFIKDKQFHSKYLKTFRGVPKTEKTNHQYCDFIVIFIPHRSIFIHIKFISQFLKQQMIRPKLFGLV